MNDRLIYTPTEVYRDFALADPALQSCVEQTIEDQQHRKASQLTTLNCSNAGIQTVRGLQHFTELRRLKLNANSLSSIDALHELPKLEILLLADNQIVNPSSLATLQELQRLDLQGNKALDCKQLAHLEGLRPALPITKPAHCMPSS